MSEKSKAYQAASKHMAEVHDYQRTLTPPLLENWLNLQISKNRDTWDVIWKAARRAEWAHSQRDLEVERDSLLAEVNQLKTFDGAQRKLLGEKSARIIGILQSNAELREKNDQLKRDLVERTIPRYDQLKASSTTESERLHTQAELVRLREQLAQERTRHQKQVTDIRNGSLLRALQAEHKLSFLAKVPAEPAGEGWALGWVKLTGETITGTVTSTPKLCGATCEGGHTCTRTPGAHRQHVCHCNHLWENAPR